MWRAGRIRMEHAGSGLWLPADAFLQIRDVQAVLFYFFIYSCLGWVIEHLFHRATAGTFAPEGFLTGPYKPMYGFAPVLLLLMIGPGTTWWRTALLGLAVPTAVEYASGYLLKRLFHMEYWDYSGHAYQLHGYVCLRFSLYWVVLSMGAVYGLHPQLALFYRVMAPLWETVWGAAAAVMLLDLAWTVLKSVKQAPVAAK